MKKLILLFVVFLGFFNAFCQPSITPAVSTEQCPGVTIVFTVTISAKSITSVHGTALNISPVVEKAPYNKVSNSGAITFNFDGRFADYNNKQTFTVEYVDATDASKTQDFSFTKIKSLQTYTSEARIEPSPAVIVAQRCQAQNFAISFANVKYNNPYVAPTVTYGTVTTY